MPAENMEAFGRCTYVYFTYQSRMTYRRSKLDKVSPLPPSPSPLPLQIEANSGISLDHQSTPPLPEFMPPLLLVAPWVLKVHHICTYKSGKGRGLGLRASQSPSLMFLACCAVINHSCPLYHILSCINHCFQSCGTQYHTQLISPSCPPHAPPPRPVPYLLPTPLADWWPSRCCVT